MERPSIWLMLAIVLASLLFLREPRLQQYDEAYLQWLLRNSPSRGPMVPLTVVDIGRDSIVQKKEANAPPRGDTATSPIEFALFLQAALDFKPTVVAFEPIWQWRDRD